MKFITYIFVALVSLAVQPVLAGEKNQPNIIYLMADDLGWVDIHSPIATSGYGSKYYETPNIDRLAEEGLSFTYAYTQQNCQPTRTALLSGQYATGKYNDTYNVVSLNRYDKRSSEWPNIKIQPYDQTGSVSADAMSLLEMAQSAGYTTAWFGKNHGTGKTANLPKDHGVDHNFATNKKVSGKVNGKKKKSNYLALKDDKKGWIFDGPIQAYAEPYTKPYIKENLLPYANGNDPLTLVGKTKHYSDALTDSVVDYLKAQAKKQKPFMAYVPFHAVHSAIVTRDDLLHKYNNKPSKDPRHTRADYAGFVEHLDQMVARILDNLNQLGLDKNTVVIFTSDNGGINKFSGNAPLRGDKGMFYEGGIRVPFIVKWPGVVKPATTNAQPTHCIDVYPTLADIIGADLSKVPQKLDGESLLPILTGAKQKISRDNIYWHFPGYMDKRNFPRSVIQKRVENQLYKLFFNYGTGDYELYNISEDMGEAVNLMASATKENKRIAQLLNKDLVSWLTLNKAPTGKWRANNEAVSYPSISMSDYKVPSQEKLTPLSDKKILRPFK